MQRLDKWTTAVSAALVIAALLACKKKKEEPPPAAKEPPAATAPAAPTPAPTATQEPTAAASPKLGDVKRFTDKEKEATGAVKVLENDVKVFNEPDEKTEDVATLSKDIFVFRLATIDDKWVLVEFPSGVGKVSPGWVEAKFLQSKVEAVARDSVAKQAKSATIKPASSVAAVTSAAPSASVKPVASVAPSASAKPASSAPKPAGTAPKPTGTAPKPTGTAPAKKPPPLSTATK